MILSLFFRLLNTDYFMANIQILCNDVFHALAGLNPWKVYDLDGVPHIVLKNCTTMLVPCLVKLFCVCLTTFIYSSCWKYAYIQPVPKKDDCLSLSNYRPIALISCLPKVYESLINRKIQRHLSAHNLLSDRQYGFLSGCSTDDLLAFLTDSWSSSFGDSVSFGVVLNISKDFDRVWPTALISKLSLVLYL